MAKEKIDKQKLADKIHSYFNAGVTYKRQRGFYDEWQEYEQFWNSEQWPQATRDTETMPRPVTNHFASIIERKISALLIEEPTIYFEPKDCDPEIMDADEAADLLSKVALRQMNNLGGEEQDITLEEINEEVVRSAALFGTGIWCFTWDNSIRGGVEGNTAYIGDIVGQEIDPSNFFPGNPADNRIQTQPHIIVAERRPLEEVKNFYREYAGDEVDTLQPERSKTDTQVYEHENIEQDMVDPVNILHFWKKVYDEDSGRKKLLYAVECQGKLLRYEEDFYKHGLYPFVSFNWYPRKKSFWGKAESADLINNQKEINRMDAVMLYSAYTTGLPHIRIKDQFVDPRDITNDPGTIIRDKAPLNAWAVDYLRPPAMPAYPTNMRQQLAIDMKDVAGAQEAWSGKAPSAELNASAIIALQEAAGIPMRNIQKRFYRALREIGLLWLAFWKEFYTEARIIRIVEPDNQVSYFWFRGTDYQDMNFDVDVKANTASPYAKALTLANLDKMLQGGVITPDEYLEMLPPEIFPKAQSLLKKRQEQKAMMQAQMAMQGGMPGMPGMPGQPQGAGQPGMNLFNVLQQQQGAMNQGQPAAPYNPDLLGGAIQGLVQPGREGGE